MGCLLSGRFAFTLTSLLFMFLLTLLTINLSNKNKIIQMDQLGDWKLVRPVQCINWRYCSEHRRPTTTTTTTKSTESTVLIWDFSIWLNERQANPAHIVHAQIENWFHLRDGWFSLPLCYAAYFFVVAKIASNLQVCGRIFLFVSFSRFFSLFIFRQNPFTIYSQPNYEKMVEKKWALCVGWMAGWPLFPVVWCAVLVSHT